MKLTNKALIAATVSAMVVLSSQAIATPFANANETYVANEIVKTVDTSSKASAYELALTKLNALEATSPEQLGKDFDSISMQSYGAYLEDDAYITVSEKMDTSGQLVYNGLVHISLIYTDEGH